MDSLNKNFPVGQPSATGGYEWMAIRASGGGHKLVGASDTDYTAFPDDFPVPNKGGISTSGQSLFGLQVLTYDPQPGTLPVAGQVPFDLMNFTADTSPSGKWLNCDLQMRTKDTQMFFVPVTTLTTPGTKKVYYFEFELQANLQGFGHSAFSKLSAGIPPAEWAIEDRNIARDISATYGVNGVTPLSQQYSLPGTYCNIQLRAPNDPPEFEQFFDVTGCQVFAVVPTETTVNFICRVFATGNDGVPGSSTWGTMIATQPNGIYDINMHWQVPCPPQDGSMDNFWQFEPVGP